MNYNNLLYAKQFKCDFSIMLARVWVCVCDKCAALECNTFLMHLKNARLAHKKAITLATPTGWQTHVFLALFFSFSS